MSTCYHTSHLTEGLSEWQTCCHFVVLVQQRKKFAWRSAPVVFVRWFHGRVDADIYAKRVSNSKIWKAETIMPTQAYLLAQRLEGE